MLITPFNFVDIAPRPTVRRPRIDADDAGQTRAEIGAENWDQTPAKGWKLEKKLRQVGSIDKIRIMAPKDIPPEAIQKEDGCELCKAGVRNKAFV